MDRFKTFVATGIAPDGRLFAGDLNLLQDLAAALEDFAQDVQVGTLSVGDASLAVSKFGAGEIQISSAVRATGILRGLGGLFAGTYTTTERNAISSPPYGLIILNTTTNQFEWNKGTPSVPDWQPISNPSESVPIGMTMDWPWDHTQIPSNYLLPYGQAISRTTYSALHAIAAASGYPHGNGDGSTTFNMPDLRGRVTVGKDNMGGTTAGRVTAAGSGIDGTGLGQVGGAQNISLVTGELPSHTHGSTALTITGSPSNGSLAATVGSLALPNHVHSISAYRRDDGGSGSGRAYVTANGDTGGSQENPSTTIAAGNPTSNPAISGSPGLSGNISAGTLDVGGSTDAAGSGTAHNNMIPAMIVNKAMKVL